MIRYLKQFYLDFVLKSVPPPWRKRSVCWRKISSSWCVIKTGSLSFEFFSDSWWSASVLQSITRQELTGVFLHPWVLQVLFHVWMWSLGIVCLLLRGLNVVLLTPGLIHILLSEEPEVTYRTENHFQCFGEFLGTLLVASWLFVRIFIFILFINS